MKEYTDAVEDSERSNDGIDKVNTSEAASAVRDGQERHESTAHDGRDDADNDPGPAVGAHADTKANEQGEEDGDNSGRHVHQSGALRSKTKVANQSRGVGRDDATGNRELNGVSHASFKEHRGEIDSLEQPTRSAATSEDQ